MNVGEWFATRDAAYEEFERVERDPERSQEEVDAAWCRFYWVRTQLNRWKHDQPEAWREEWRRIQRIRIAGHIEKLSGRPKWAQDHLEERP